MEEEKVEIVTRSITYRDSELEDYFLLYHSGTQYELPIKFRQAVENLMYSKEVFYIENFKEMTADPNNLFTFYSWT